MARRALLRGAVSAGAVLAASGCDSPSTGANEAATSDARSSDGVPPPGDSSLSAFGTSGSAPLHAQLRPPPDAGPLDRKTVAEHWKGAARLRLWWTEAAQGAKGGKPKEPALRFAVLAEGDRAELVALVGRRTPAIVGACEPCPRLVHVVAEDPLGLQLGTLELGCHESSGLRFHGAASDACGTVEAGDLPALLSLVERIQRAAPTVALP
jgi:hypothetical protein